MRIITKYYPPAPAFDASLEKRLEPRVQPPKKGARNWSLMQHLPHKRQQVQDRIVLEDGRVAIWRQACESDADALYRMFTALSNESLYMRYIGYHRPTKEEIQAILERQGEEEISIVASPAHNENEIIAQVRCIFMNPPTDAELAVVVHDDWQNQGLGTALVRTILGYASRARVKRIVGVSGLSNDRAIHVFNKLGFSTCYRCYDSVKMTLTLADITESRT